MINLAILNDQVWVGSCQKALDLCSRFTNVSIRRELPCAGGERALLSVRLYVQSDLCRARRQGEKDRPADDRCHSSQGTPDGGKPAKKGALPKRIGRTKGGLNPKLHAVCDGKGRPLIMLLSEGLMSDDKGAALMIDAFP
ncbi:MAG: hypothetical protein ACXIT4_12705 [Erythrobacter sp.]